MRTVPQHKRIKTPKAHGRRTISLFVTGLVMLACFQGTPSATAQHITEPAELKNLKYRSIGPAAGGRVCRVSGVAGDPQIYYAATA